MTLTKYITLVTKLGFRELLMHSVRHISFHFEFSGVFIYTTHIGSDLENTSQSNKFLKNCRCIYLVKWHNSVLKL